MKMKSALPQGLSGHIFDMVVVREYEDLETFRGFIQHTQHCPRPFIVAAHQQIVADQGRGALAGTGLKRSQAQRQI